MPIVVVPEVYVPIPLTIAAGNTLSVKQTPGSISGVLVAKAYVKGTLVGTVQLTLKRVNILPPPA